MLPTLTGPRARAGTRISLTVTLSFKLRLGLRRTGRLAIPHDKRLGAAGPDGPRIDNLKTVSVSTSDG